MTPTYRIRDWDKHYETRDSRRCTRMNWLPVPTRHEGKGFRALMRHPDAASMYGCWHIILQIASKCPERGLLKDEDGPVTPATLELLIGIKASVFTEAFVVLKRIGWIEEVGDSTAGSGSIPQVLEYSGSIPQVLEYSGSIPQVLEYSGTIQSTEQDITEHNRTLVTTSAPELPGLAGDGPGEPETAGPKQEPSKYRKTFGIQPDVFTREYLKPIYDLYPKKTGPGAVYPKIAKVYSDMEYRTCDNGTVFSIKETRDLLVSSLTSQIEQWKADGTLDRENGKFIPNPETWFNQRRYMEW